MVDTVDDGIYIAAMAYDTVGDRVKVGLGLEKVFVFGVRVRVRFGLGGAGRVGSSRHVRLWLTVKSSVRGRGRRDAA